MRKTDAAAIFAGGEARGRLDIRKAAKAAGVSPATYSRRKRSPEKMTIEELRALARVMKLTNDEIISLIRG